LRQVDRVLVEVRRLSAGGRPPRSRLGQRRLRRRARLLRGQIHDLREVLPQVLRLDLLQLPAHAAHEPLQLVVDQQREDRVTAPDLRRAVVDRPDRPRLRQHLHQRRAERWRARVARLQIVEARGQLAREPRAVDLVVLQDVRAVAVRRVEQLHQVVLDLDVVVRAREAQPRRRFDRAPGLVVQLPDQRSQVHVHGSLSIAASGSLPTDLPDRSPVPVPVNVPVPVPVPERPGTGTRMRTRTGSTMMPRTPPPFSRRSPTRAAGWRVADSRVAGRGGADSPTHTRLSIRSPAPARVPGQGRGGAPPRPYKTSTVSSASRPSLRVRIHVDQPSRCGSPPSAPSTRPGTSSALSASCTSKSNWSWLKKRTSARSRS